MTSKTLTTANTLPVLVNYLINKGVYNFKVTPLDTSQDFRNLNDIYNDQVFIETDLDQDTLDSFTKKSANSDFEYIDVNDVIKYIEEHPECDHLLACRLYTNQFG